MQCQSLLTPPSSGGHALASVSAFFSLLRLSYIDPCDPVKNPPRPFPNPNPHHRLHILTIRRYIAIGSPPSGVPSHRAPPQMGSPPEPRSSSDDAQHVRRLERWIQNPDPHPMTPNTPDALKRWIQRWPSASIAQAGDPARNPAAPRGLRPRTPTAVWAGLRPALSVRGCGHPSLGFRYVGPALWGKETFPISIVLHPS